MTALDQFGHLAIKESQQQSPDVRAIDVGVGHDDDAVVSQLLRLVFLLADASSQRGDQGDDLLRGDELFETRLLDIEDLALQGQDRLKLSVAPLLGRTAGGIALDEIQFAQRRILLLAVGQFPGQAHAVQHALSARHFARLPGRLSGSGGIDDLAGDNLGIDGLFQ